jgi:hypothetical protein
VYEVPALATVAKTLGARPARNAEVKIAATPAYGVSRGMPGP